LDSISADLTNAGCMTLPLKTGGGLNLSWTRMSGWSSLHPPFSDTWTPAGVGGVFGFLPQVTSLSGERLRLSDQGQMRYTLNDPAPSGFIRYVAKTSTTYWTEYDQDNKTYFEYFAGSSLLTTDPMFGRLNRVYDNQGKELSYTYSANAGGKQLLRRISGLGGNLVPYFGYVNETIDSTHFAPLTTIHIANIVDATKSQSIYFEYTTLSNNKPYLTKVVSPSGCVRQFVPVTPLDSFGLYRISAEVDPEGYTTYFVYVNSLLTKAIEPEGVITYYDYVANLTSRTTQSGAKEMTEYQVSGGASLPTPMITKQYWPLGQTTYFEYDTALARPTKRVDANALVTYYSWVGGASSVPNRFAVTTETSGFNGATVGFGYETGTYLVARKTEPRHVDGTFPVVTYFTHDSYGNTTSITDAKRNTTQYTYDADGELIVQEQDARGYTTAFGYSSLGQLERVLDPLGGVIYYSWDDYDNKLTAVSPRASEGGFFVTYHTYDTAARRPVRSMDPLGNSTYYEWGSNDLLLAKIDARGTKEALFYSWNGRPSRTLVTDASDQTLFRAYFGYDSSFSQTRVQDALGNTTYFEYDANNQLTATQDPVGNRSTPFYDSMSNRIAEVDASGHATYFSYDALSRLTCQRDALGNTTYYFYDLADNVTVQIDPRSAPSYFFYDALDRAESTRDALGNASYYFYDAGGNTTVVRDVLGNSGYFFYDALNRQTVVRDALGIATYFGFDAIGNLKRSVDARQGVSYFTYDALDRLQSRLDALGNPAYFFYDGVGNTTATRNARGAATYFFYDGLGRVTSMRDSVGNASYYFYDAVGNRTHLRDPRGNAGYFFYDQIQRTSVVRDAIGNATYFFYDAAGNRTHGRDAKGNATYFFYDAVDRLSGVRDSLGRSVYFYYDAAGNRTCTVNAAGQVTYYSYDLLGRLFDIHLPESRVFRFEHDTVGNTTKVSDSDAVASQGYGVQPYGTSFYGGWSPADTRTFYDTLYRPVSRRDAVGNAVYFFYDSGSNRTAVRDSLAHATYFGYDALNRVTRILDATGSSAYFEFDSVGNLTKLVDPNNRSVQTRYDEIDRPDALRLADAASVYFFYDQSGNRLKEVNPRGGATYYAYDALNRTTCIVDALWRSLYFEYDSVGNLSRSVDAEGTSATQTYDAVNQRTQTTFAPAGAAVSGSLRSDPYYVYDSSGNVVQMGDLWGLHRFGYDGLDRQTRHLYPKGQVVYFEYGARSQLASIVYAGASGAEKMAYDLLRRQTRAQSPSGATAYFAYDAASNLKQRFLGNSAKLDMTYDAADRQDRWRGTDKNGGALSYFDYTRDPKGLVTKIYREATHTIYYQYDEADRLLTELWSKAGTPEVYAFRYAYDAAGNRLRQRVTGSDVYYSYDEAHQLRVSGTTSAWATPTYYIYDKDGSLTNLVEPSGATYFAYNAAGLIARIQWKDASKTYFFYDGALQRYGMVDAGATSATYFLWNGPNLIQELNADGTVKEEHTNAQTPIAGIGQLVETNRPGQAQAKIYPIQDPRGSITKWMQSDGATVFAAREYDSFGNLIPNSSAGTWPGRIGYQGQSWLEILSANGSQRLMLSPTRIYDPGTGRFLQNEPLLGRRPFAHYLYARQNPINVVDPSGLQDCKDDNQKCDNAPSKGFDKKPSNCSGCSSSWVNPYGIGWNQGNQLSSESLLPVKDFVVGSYEAWISGQSWDIFKGAVEGQAGSLYQLGRTGLYDTWAQTFDPAARARILAAQDAIGALWADSGALGLLEGSIRSIGDRFSASLESYAQGNSRKAGAQFGTAALDTYFLAKSAFGGGRSVCRFVDSARNIGLKPTLQIFGAQAKQWATTLDLQAEIAPLRPYWVSTPEYNGWASPPAPVTLKEGTVVIRYYGGGSKMGGKWVTTDINATPRTLALPAENAATDVAAARIPSGGLQVQAGTAAPIPYRPGFGGGGAQQLLPKGTFLDFVPQPRPGDVFGLLLLAELLGKMADKCGCDKH